MDGQRPGYVEFLDEPDEGDGDEVVLRLPNRVHGRLVVVGTLLLVLAAVSVARGLNNGSSGGRSADRSARPSSPPAREAADPATMANSAYALLGPCPTGAQCFVAAPGAAATALRAAFPGAVLQIAANVLANRAGHSDPGLLRRVILSRRGDEAIQVRIQAGATPNPESPRRPSIPNGVARVTAHREGYAISVIVIGPGALRSVPQATRLAGDLRLLTTG